MKIDLGDIKVIKVVNGIERPHTSAAGLNERGDRLPYVVEGRNFFPIWETSKSSRIRHVVNKLLQAPCCPVSQSARQRVRKFSMSQKTQNMDRSTWDHQGRHTWLEIDARLRWRHVRSSVFRRILIQNHMNQWSYWLDYWCQISGGVTVSTTLVVKYIQFVSVLVSGVKLPYCETIYFV